jgi:hypothetical protein
MSIVAFKKKSVIRFGSNVSGKPPGGVWLPQGPFGNGKKMFAPSEEFGAYGPVGFSINGGTRNVGYVGKTMHMSKQGTPFRGQYPYGHGGCSGQYATPLPFYNSGEVIVLGDQYKYIKPSVLSTYGMLRNRFRWAYNGQYPNYVVKQNYTGNLTDSASQGVYLQKVSAANICVTDINAAEKYIDDIKIGGPTLCKLSTAGFKYNDMARNGKYVKFIYNPQDSSQYTLQIQRRCADPSPEQRPIPVTTNASTCSRGLRVGSQLSNNSNPIARTCRGEITY